MDGYTTDYINLIADNLRDRYDNGFPILKELIQNADDAKARTFVFAHHPGFFDADNVHPLLKGPGLWFFNDGEFKPSDARALRSFGINSKAGDASAIGKFGLGMKSVFHLCEALFYLAWDGQKLHQQGLNPWKQDGQDTHPEWDHIHDRNWVQLESLAKPLVGEATKSWFLLWVPLRRRDQVRNGCGDEIAIISRFPGDDPHPDLDFLNDPGLGLDLAKILPLLRHLERIEHHGESNAFALKLDANQRLLGEWAAERSNGQVVLGDSGQSLRFAGMGREDRDPHGIFSGLKDRGEWPRSRYRDARNQEQQAADKTRPEAAVLFCSGPSLDSPSNLHWAVFLPVEQGGEPLKIDAGNPGHSLILHGQFFIDAGRKKPHGLEDLHNKPPAEIGPDPIDDSLLRRTWNQHLAQRVLMPLVIPALEHYAADARLNDADTAGLTRALGDTHWFRTFASHICRDDAWMRTMAPDAKHRWARVHDLARKQLRPLPWPPKSDPQRPWQVFPRLGTSDLLRNLRPFDVTAPSLSDWQPQWQEAELDDLLSKITGLFTDGPRMDYLAEFLGHCAGPFLKTGRLQQRLIVTLRAGFIATNRDGRRQHAEKSRCVLGFVEPARRLMLATDLPEQLLRNLWGIDSPILLIPRGLESDPVGTPEPSEEAWAAWLRVLDRHLALDGADADQQAVLDVVVDLIKRLSANTRGPFLRVHEDLRIIAIRDARTGRNRAVSGAEIRAVREAGTLFGFAQGTQERERLGMTPLLAAVLPGSRIWLVRADRYRDLFPGEPEPSRADDGRACLAAIGREDSGRLGSLKDRRELLKATNDPGKDQQARQGLRFLLHGSADHHRDDGQPLWFPGHNQHPVWAKLWGQIHTGDRWSLVPSELADMVPRSGWLTLDVREIDAPNLLGELARLGTGIPEPKDFDQAEREEILSKIEDQGLWQRLPLHTTLTGEPVSALKERVYLAPEGGGPNDPLAAEAILIVRSGNRTVADQQRNWLKPLDDRARIEIALATPKPKQHWQTIMDALERLGTSVEGKLAEKLRAIRWLPTRQGEPVKPEDVIDLPDGLADEARRLVAEHRAAHVACYAVPADLDDHLQAHAAWEQVRQGLFSSDESGLEYLGLLLADLPDYHIGQWLTAPRPDTVALLGRCKKLPGWQILHQASQQPFSFDIAWQRLGSGLGQFIEPERILAALNWLNQKTSDWLIRKAAYDGYLGCLAAHPVFVRTHLADLRLASRGKKWRSPKNLCVGAHGVNPDWLLDKQQQQILGNLIQRASQAPKQIMTDADAIPPGNLRQSANATPQHLTDYFRPWRGGLVPIPMIGALTAILGPGEQGLLRVHAEDDLKPHDFEWLLDRLPWTDPGWEIWNQRLKWMGGKTLAQALGLLKPAVEIVPDDDVHAINLLGEPIVVPLEQEPQNLLAGPLCWKGGFRVVIPLRAIVPDDHSPERLGAMLRDTAERLYVDLYNQKRPDFEPLWRELDRSDQLEIGVARRLILDHIEVYLKPLSTGNAELKRALAVCHEERRRIAQADDDGRDAGPARRHYAQALENLVGVIEERDGIDKAVLAGVRDKLGQFQYDSGSIPFELFQNADDALVEANQIAAFSDHGEEVPLRDRRFLVEVGSDALRFIHWGRPVNARGPIEFGGEERGFGRDLEKMLVLFDSDKDAAQGLTGKFGIGFKSVLLACDRPRILSGRLALEIVAGILPQPWPKAHAARNALTRHAGPTRLPGTLIELPGVKGTVRAKVLARFEGLTGVLCAFGQAIRSIEIHRRSLVQDPGRVTWEPEELCSGVEFARLCVAGDWGQETGAICLRSEHGALLLALGPDGFRPLPDEVPTLWVTAPTKAQARLGFAVNGRFEINTARAELKGDSDSNSILAGQIGTASGESLGTLFNHSCADWAAVRERLGLAADLNLHDFWHSLWVGLTGRWFGRQSDAVTALVRELVRALLRRLSDQPGSVPNGLAEPLQSLTSTCEVHYELAKELAAPPVLAVLGSWGRFTATYPAGSLVAPDIGAILKHADLAHPVSLGLAALVAVLDPPRVEPGDAMLLGALLLLTEENEDWRSKGVQKRLGRLQFRTGDDGWATAGSLLANGVEQIEPDEVLRFALAPLDRRLHRDYCVTKDDEAPALTLFLRCRERLQAPADVLAQWILAACNAEGQHAALVYLADGELGEPVAERVRGLDWLQGVFQYPSILAQLSEEQRLRLQRRLASREVLAKGYQSVDAAAWVPPPVRRRIDLATALKNIHAWSLTNDGINEVRDYRQSLYPPSGVNLQIDPDSGRNGVRLTS